MDLSKYKTRSGMTISSTLSDTVEMRKKITKLILEEAAGSKNEEAIKAALATSSSDKAEAEVESKLSEKITKFCNDFSEEECTDYYYLSDVFFKLGITATKEISKEFESKGKKKLAENIMKSAFPFSKIVDLEPSSVEIIYNETEITDFAKALKGADSAVREFIFTNLPPKVSTMLREEIEYMGPIRVKDSEEAKEKILKTILNLLSEGKISFSVK